MAIVSSHLSSTMKTVQRYGTEIVSEEKTKGGNDMEGVLVYSSREHGYVLADKKGKFQKLLRAGQQLYIYLCSVWVPVILQYSEKLGEWYFKYLPNVQVNGCKAMLKAD